MAPGSPEKKRLFKGPIVSIPERLRFITEHLQRFLGLCNTFLVATAPGTDLSERFSVCLICFAHSFESLAIDSGLGIELLQLLERVGAIERVALGGDEAGVGDDAAEFRFVGAVADAGGVHHVFFDQYTADVVGAELQADLADLDAGSEPAGLDVINIVEIQTADGERFQVIDRCGFRNFLAERRIVRSENPWNERGEAAGILLNAANTLEMIDAMAQLFAAAEHHGGGGSQAQVVRVAG